MGQKNTVELRRHNHEHHNVTDDKRTIKMKDKVIILEKEADELVEDRKYKKAEPKLRKALSCFHEMQESRVPHSEKVKILRKLAYVSDKLNDKRKSLHYLEMALSTLRQVQNDYLTDPDTKIADLLTDLSRTWWRIGDHEKAIEYGRDAVTMKEDLFESDRNSKTCLALAYAHYHLGKTYVELHHCEDALRHLKRASWCLDEITQHSLFSNKIKDETPMIRFKAKVYSATAEAYQVNRDLFSAINYVKLGFQLFKLVHGTNSDHKDIVTVLRLLVSIEREMKEESQNKILNIKPLPTKRPDVGHPR